jgi:hypothetical protein
LDVDLEWPVKGARGREGEEKKNENARTRRRETRYNERLKAERGHDNLA